MLIKSVKNKDYGLLVDHVKINMEQGYIISRLKIPIMKISILMKMKKCGISNIIKKILD